MMQRDVRWNFGAAFIDAAGWGLGMSFISEKTILPLFVRELTPSPVAVGMIQAVMLFGWLVPGILVSGPIERLPRVKGRVLWVAMLERSMLLLMVPLCLWLGESHRLALLGAFFACWFVMNTALGANMPAYYKLIAKTIPAALRGRLYGYGGAISRLLGLGATFLAGWLLAHWGYPAGYALCFLGAFIAQTVSVLPLGIMREGVQPVHVAPPPEAPWRALRALRDDRALRLICAGVALFSLNQMAAAFYTLYALERFGARVEDVVLFTAVLTGAAVFAFLLVGWLGDRHGNRAALLVSTVAGILAAGMAWLAPELWWLYLVFAVNEVAAQGWGVCGMNYVLELCPPERSSTYTAVFGVVTGPFRVVLPLLGGVLAQTAGFGAVFGVAVAGSIVTLLLLLYRLPEPRETALAGGGAARPRALTPLAEERPGARH